MVRVNRQTYANYVKIDIFEYEAVHGIIEAYGGRVKQFTQDLAYHDDWYLFYEMANLQRPEFTKELNEYLNTHKRSSR